MLKRHRIYYLLKKTFDNIVQKKPAKVKLFRYKKEKLVSNPEIEISLDGKKFINVRKLLDILGLGAVAFWKWMSDGRFKNFTFIKFKKCWYIDKKQVQNFIRIVLKKQASFYWQNIFKEDGDGRPN